jgi:hypothetical protein
MIKVTRFSDADWASELKEITVVGTGGIGSWTVFNLSRIGHSLILCDNDRCDATNVTGGQMFRNSDIGTEKVFAIQKIVREFGCTNQIDAISELFSEDIGCTPITITGLDNMKARKQVFESWENLLNNSEDKENFLFIDGRLTMELNETFAIRGDIPEQIENYKTNWLFDDSEVEDLACTAKQTTFMAMNIASLITASVCNFLTNLKLGMEVREVPFHQKFYSPSFSYQNEYITETA